MSGDVESLIEALAAHRRLLGHSDKTTKIDAWALRQLGKHPDQCTLADYERVILRSRSASTRATYSRRLRSSVSLLHDLGLVSSTTHQKIPQLRQPKTEPRPLSDEQLQKLFKEAEEPWKTMFRIAFLTGARAGELWRMCGSDLTEGRNGPEILMHGKGGKEVVIPCHPTAARLIEGFGTLGLLWPDFTTPDFLAQQGSRYLRSIIGGEGHSMHSLRHTMATRLLEATGDITIVQKLMRHESVTSTMIYAEVASSKRRDAIELLSA
jgi:integrase